MLVTLTLSHDAALEALDKLAQNDSGHIIVTGSGQSALLRSGDVLLAVGCQGLRGESLQGTRKLLLEPVEDVKLLVGRQPTDGDLANYKGPSKQDLRQKIWDKLEAEDVADIPRPCHHRIPNFKGSKGACDQLLSQPCFTSAKVVKINPDKPQQHARFLTLQQRKKLLVPTPRLRHGLFNHIQPPEGASSEDLKRCCTAQGVKDFGYPLSLQAKMHVDLVVIGSVVVSQKGFRIGKGEGFADMEWAMMASTGAVGPDTLIVTVVHDAQVMDIPDFLVDSHDMTVDFIMTPTRVISCSQNLPRPGGIIWEKLTTSRINEIPILKKIMEMERSSGKNIRLKEDDNDYIQRDNGWRSRGQGARGRGRFGYVTRGSGGRNFESSHHSFICYTCQQPGHLARDCQSEEAKGTIRGLNRTWRSSNRGRGRGRGRETGEEMRCYNCNEAGHLARDCLS